MRTMFLCTLALAAVQLAVPAGAEADGVERTLRKLRREFVAAVNARDIERARACWAADARILVEGRPAIEGAVAFEFARRMLASSRIVSFDAEAERIDHSGNLAYELGRYTFTIRQSDGSVVEDRGKYLDVWKKHGRSDWRIIAHAPSGTPSGDDARR